MCAQSVSETQSAEVVGCSLGELIDSLSTRLIIDGVRSIAPRDLRDFARAAKDVQRVKLAASAESVADQFEKMMSDADCKNPDLTRLLSASLVEFRTLAEESVDEPVAAPSQASVLAADHELVREFITESTEHLVAIEGQMMVLEKDSTAPEALNAVFRAFHTIKGLSGLLEFSTIQKLAHEVETLLDLVRNQTLKLNTNVVDVVLEATDVVRHEIAGIEDLLADRVPEASLVTEPLLQRVRAASRGEAATPVAKDSEALASKDDLSLQTNEPATLARAEAGVVVEAVRPERRASDSNSIRIETTRLDQLMDMVGEMVIAQTLISHSPALATVKDPRLVSDLSQLARITADVQRITTGMRMVPIGIQFQKSTRVVRDLSRRAGKQIVLETSGEDTELDKTIAEQLADPLLHMVRNSIDHGIETPEERKLSGKDPVARVRMSAYHQSGQIVIEVSDDGRGLNRDRILAKAVQNGLIQPGAQLTDDETFLLIFEPGFSTAEKITDISGRGVGMDVVRRHVQKLRGRIEVQSKIGEGTTFYIKLPLTLAIIDGLVVAVGEERYILPIFSVREMFRPTPEMLSTVSRAGEMVLVRGGLMPITRLHRVFNRTPRTSSLSEGTLIVAESGGHPFCIFVDDLLGKQEVVIKGLGPTFKNVTGIAGCAILGDGRVGLILDIDGIYQKRAA